MHLRLFTFRYALQRRICNALAAFLLLGTAANADNLTLVALGDSLTAGYGLAADEGFVPQLEAWLKTAGAPVTVVNAGVSGDTTAGGLARLEWSLSPETDALMVNLGGNDMLRGVPPAEARANLTAILAGAKAKGLPVLLVGQQAPGNYGPDYKAAFDAIYPELAAEYGALLYPFFFQGMAAGENDPAALAAFMQADGIHPNPEGVARIVADLGPVVRDFLVPLQP